jgi:diguanylate cyclase (GGDEF)-like protein
LVRLARHDALTGLANRFVFHETLHELAAGSEPFAMLLIDIDHFKDVNDTYGHPTGDALLTQAAMRLRACVRRADTIARIGGDEFAVLLTGLDHKRDAAALAERIIADFATPFALDGASFFCGTSIGIALSAGEAPDPDKMLKNADLALYAAKAAGRQTYRFFSADMAQHVAARQQLKSCLRGALERNEMSMHFQPVIELKSGRIGGFEGLLRWHSRDRGMVSPSVFIPIAEETGLIVEIGYFALQTACRQAATWPDPVWVAVNLSPVQFRDAGLFQAVAQALLMSGLPARRLELEITETALLRDDEATLATLHSLRDMGVRIALDDFGTGYASLSYLRSFPFDKIKIDRCFIRDLPGSRESAAIVRAMTSLGRGLGLTITAEGVETQQQLEVVRLQGCAEAQGYYFSAAVPAEDTPALFETVPSHTARMAKRLRGGTPGDYPRATGS